MMDPEVERQVRERAYRIWEEEGRPHGRDIEHWLRAAKELAAEQAGGTADPATDPVAGSDPGPGNDANPRRRSRPAAAKPAANRPAGKKPAEKATAARSEAKTAGRRGKKSE